MRNAEVKVDRSFGIDDKSTLKKSMVNSYRYMSLNLYLFFLYSSKSSNEKAFKRINIEGTLPVDTFMDIKMFSVLLFIKSMTAVRANKSKGFKSDLFLEKRRSQTLHQTDHGHLYYRTGSYEEHRTEACYTGSNRMFTWDFTGFYPYHIWTYTPAKALCNQAFQTF